METLVGCEKSAEVPTLSPDPALVPSAPPPATVVTVPSGSMRRNLLLPVSAMKKMPATEMVIPDGLKNSALVPTKSDAPDKMPVAPPPARVVTTPPAVEMARIL